MYKILILLLFFNIKGGFSQTLKNMYPKMGITHDLSKTAEQTLKVRDELAANIEKLNAQQQGQLDSVYSIFSETRSNIWDVLDDGAHWSDYGGPYAVRASSTLPSTKANQYVAGNVNDNSLKTAWVEGVKGSGEGEYLEFFFKNKSPRVNTVVIINGYVKESQLWSANNRVKTMDMFINEKYYGTLQLKDIPAEQIFELPLSGHRKDGKDLVLKFIIRSVYPGDKYDDTAITEIYFKGSDVY